MPNKNYINGRNFEYKVKKIWEEKGHFVVRSSGSHGKADLVALRGYEGAWMNSTFVYLIQCKATGKISKAEKDELGELANSLCCNGVLAYRDEKGKYTEEFL